MILIAVSCLTIGLTLGVVAIIRWVGEESEERPR